MAERWCGEVWLRSGAVVLWLSYILVKLYHAEV